MIKIWGKIQIIKLLQNYIYISEYPFESIPGTNLIFDIDNIEEVEYSKNNLRSWFKDGFQLYVGIEKE